MAQRALSEAGRIGPHPFACDSGYVVSNDAPANGFVLALAPWAQQAGLQRGDQIVAIAGTPVANGEERVRAWSHVPIGGPVRLEVARSGKRVSLALPCRSPAAKDRAMRETLEAASRGDWTACIAAARDLRQLAGFTAVTLLTWEHNCTRIQFYLLGSPITSPAGRSLVSLHYEVGRLMVQESRYAPGMTENVRSTVLQFANDLRTWGFPTLADDLEAQLKLATTSKPPRSLLR